MDLIHICPDSWGANCYLLISAGQATVVDPSPSAKAIADRAEEAGAKIKNIVLTHGHFDHVISAESLHNMTGAPVMIHRGDAEMLGDAEKNAYLSFFGTERSFRAADILMDDGDILTLGNEKIRVMSTPGHSPGSVCLVTDDFIITGDTLFAEGFGRIDLYGGSLHQMKTSLEKFLPLPHSLPIYPGHGASSTLGEALSKIRFLKNQI